MSNLFIKSAIRTFFVFTSRDTALRKSEEFILQYMDLAKDLSDEAGDLCVEVPPMRGIDEDMRKWSFYMILEHNAIVNRNITETVVQLTRGEVLKGATVLDFKKGVMPSPSADKSQVELFTDSIKKHIEVARSLGRLRGTKTSLHPIFGNFDAHKWNCMFAFHLGLHFPQADYVVNKAKIELGSGVILPQK